MKPVLFLLPFSLLLTVISCNTTETDEDNVTSGSRDYEWTVDTIKIPFTYLFRISGSSSSDVWAVGPGGGLDQTMWHYDGTSWNTDGVSRFISPLSVISFSQNDVWVAGYDGNIWHYDGAAWKSNIRFLKSGYDISFWNIWGTDPKNLFAIGYSDSAGIRKGMIVKYDGKSWKEKAIPTYTYNLLRMKKNPEENGKYYLLAYSGDSKKNAIFEYYNDNVLSMLFDEIVSLETGLFPQEIGGKLYLTKGKTIYYLKNNNFKELTVIDKTRFTTQIFGRSAKDIFLIMQDGIAHYNGSNAEYLYQFPTNRNISILDVAVFEKEVFFLANDYDNYQNIILRGKLKENN